MYHGMDWYGRTLEVREVCASTSPLALTRLTYTTPRTATWGFRGQATSAVAYGVRRLGGRGLRGGGFRGGFHCGAYSGAGGYDFSNQDLYTDYSGPDQGGAYGDGGSGYGTHGGGHHGAGFAGPGAAEYGRLVWNLPWSTANEDLVELFETMGQLKLAEILFDGAHLKGCGVVQFAHVGEAETAIAKVQQYLYGG
ncbi:hypothetical protein K438DRAFT_279560 [Mycena galopus ATCC 62051]|nr:hypothetical protein K438DRAFT_279560 [Mycena galopus ATCC 62051]